MLPRNGVLLTRQLVNLNTNAVRNKFKPPKDYRPPNMNDLPVPCGSWQELHDKRQRKYNLQLAMGVGFFVFSCIVAQTSGLFQWHALPPARPHDKVSKYPITE